MESLVWPNGPACPHCGEKNRTGQLNGKSTKIGTRKCYACRKKFTVTVGTVFEDSHIPVHQWLQVVHLMVSSKKGISSHQIMRIMEVQYKTAWFVVGCADPRLSGALTKLGEWRLPWADGGRGVSPDQRRPMAGARRGAAAAVLRDLIRSESRLSSVAGCCQT